AVAAGIGEETGMKRGLGGTLALLSFGWIGIRGMAWFLFGQFGTPSMLAFISRRPMVDEDAPRPVNGKPVPAWWRQPVDELKREIEWLPAKSNELLDYLVLPVLQIPAAAVNFGLVPASPRQGFSTPFQPARRAT